jgi:hypothetical protein
VVTITVAASRSPAFPVSEMEMLVGSAIVLGVLAWMVLARIRRARHQPHARCSDVPRGAQAPRGSQRVQRCA